MKTISIAVIFDKAKKSDLHTKKGLVQIRVIYGRKPTYFSTGIKLYKDQWSNKLCKVVNAGLDTDNYNSLIELYISKINAYNLQRQQNNEEFDPDALRRILQGGVSENFIKWARQRLETKKGTLRAETIRSHRTNLNIIEEFGRFNKFSDITLQNLIRFQEWMINEKHYASQTLHTKHKVLKVYVMEAERMGKITDNPYNKFVSPRGRSIKQRIITEMEMEQIKSASIPPSYENVRDLMLIQYYTGLAYADLAQADWSKIKKVNGMDMIVGERSKSGVGYYIPILPETKAILEKYDYSLRIISNQQCNARYKKVAEFAKIENPQEITTHTMRKGCGTYLLNNGIRIEVVSKILGHSNTLITQKIYAKLHEETVADEVKTQLMNVNE